jgi:hypothetical protein
VKARGVIAGAGLGSVLIAVLWLTGVMQPPEALTRKVAAYSAVFPGPVEEAEVERIPCPPLRRLRLYVVCTQRCEDVWRIVGVRGLRPENLANLSRLPPEPEGEARRRFNLAVAREGLRLDLDGARDMVGCYLRLDGLDASHVLLDSDLPAVERARESEESMRRLAERLNDTEALSRILMTELDGGFEGRFLYWGTTRPGGPVMEFRLKLAPDGRLVRLLQQEVLAQGPPDIRGESESPLVVPEESGAGDEP